MNPISPDALLKQMQWRYATKKFDPAKKISDADWSALLEALILAPSSYGLQPWKFLVVKDPAVREQLLPASWGQRQVVDASHMLVLAAHQKLGENEIGRFVNRTAEVRAVPPESLDKFKAMLVRTLLHPTAQSQINYWAANQVYIALGTFMTAAAMMAIDTCPMEGIEPKKYDEILGLKGTDYATVVACPAGYRAAEDKYATAPKVRYKREDVLTEI